MKKSKNLSSDVEKTQETRCQSGKDTTEASSDVRDVANRQTSSDKPTEQSIGNQISPRQTCGGSVPPTQNPLSGSTEGRAGTRPLDSLIRSTDERPSGSENQASPAQSPKPKRRLERNASHQVYKLKDGSIVAGCSTICKLGGSAEGLIRWANQMGLKGVDTTKVRDKAADLGTLSHFQISCFLENVEPDMREYSDEDISKSRFGFDKFMDFWTKEKLTVVASEKEMVSELYRYGGTLDIVARDEEGLLVLLDCKSAKSVYWEMRMQLGGYESLWGENNEEQISRRAILRIPPTEGGEFQAHWFPQKKADKYMAIFRKQAELYTTIRDYDKLH